MTSDLRVVMANMCADRGYKPGKENGFVFVLSPDKRMRIYFKNPVVGRKEVTVKIVLKEKDTKDDLFEIDSFLLKSFTDRLTLKSDIDKMLDEIEERFCMKKTFSVAQKKLKSEFEKIANKRLGISTLESQYSDSLDFHEVSVWGIEAALMDAYNLGRNSKK